MGRNGAAPRRLGTWRAERIIYHIAEFLLTSRIALTFYIWPAASFFFLSEMFQVYTYIVCEDLTFTLLSYPHLSNQGEESLFTLRAVASIKLFLVNLVPLVHVELTGCIGNI